MYRKAVCWVVLLLVFGSAGSVSAELVAHWKLDETTGTAVSDSSGNGYNGTLIGGATWVAGYIDGALEVNGSSGYADFGNPPDWPAGKSPRSLCGWGRTDTVASGYRWMAAYGSAATGQAMFIGMNGSTLVAGGYGGDDVTVTDGWKVGEWCHVALTYDGVTAKAYTNGVQAGALVKDWNLTLNRAHLGRQVNDAAEFWNGAIDDVRLYDHVLTVAEIKALIPVKPKARKPVPEDGAIGVTSQLLSWTAGDNAKWHDVYLGTSPELTEANRVANRQTFAMYYHMAGLEPGVTYYWRVDEVEADGTTVHTGDVWTFTAASLKAFKPAPAQGAKFQLLDVTVSWAAGMGALTHDVYFGLDEAAVAAGDAGTFQTNQVDTTYKVTGLTLDAQYFWRIDEVKAGGAKVLGDVWSFRTLPNIAVSDPDLLGWWTFDEQEGVMAVDWSGHGTHGTFNGNVKWTEGMVGGALDFDGDGDFVDFGNPADWPAGAEPRSLCGWAKTDNVAAGYRWIAAYGSPNTSQAMFIGLYGTTLNGGGYGDDIEVNGFWETDVWHHIALTYDGVIGRLYADGVEIASMPKTWNLIRSRAHVGRQVNTAAEFWDGMVDDVRVYKIALTPEQVVLAMRGDPALAWAPQPKADANVDIRGAEALSWSAGDGAAQHDVYLGQDRNAVKAADTTSPLYQGRQAGTGFSTDGLVEFGGGSYFWRIDEVEADGATVHKGMVWGFTVPDYLIVDEFEDYTDVAGNSIYEFWIDGLTTLLNGSVVGYMDAIGGTFGELTITHDGSRQSMPFEYNNDGSPHFFSEAERTFDPVQDWTEYDVNTLSLWFRGNPVAYMETGVDSFKMSATGADIWNTADECRFAYKSLSGNGSIVARVVSLANTGGWAKAGVMIRQSLDANSKHAAVVITPSNGVSFPYRTYTADASYQVGMTGLQAPYWVRLTRTGDAFKAEYSPNGTTWTALGTDQTISMTGAVYIGLCLSSYNPAVPTIAEFSNVTTTGSVTGAWQVEEIGVDHPGNDADDLYVIVEDSTSKKATKVHPDPEAVLTTEWTQWTIPLSDLTGLNLKRIKKMYIGVGDSKSSTPTGTGLIYIDDIHLLRP